MCVASRNNKLCRVGKVWKRELRLGCEYTDTRACVGEGAMFCAPQREVTNCIELLRIGSESLDWVQSERTLMLESAKEQCSERRVEK
ncbi:hypothetical protein J6590_107233 [Homalodisca vitripennis]|nr:hypothetical protein J6590_107233 [Homalodisca vitripennis]